MYACLYLSAYVCLGHTTSDGAVFLRRGRSSYRLCVNVSLCVCICSCMSVCMFVCMCVPLYAYLSVSVCLSVCLGHTSSDGAIFLCGGRSSSWLCISRLHCTSKTKVIITTLISSSSSSSSSSLAVFHHYQHSFLPNAEFWAEPWNLPVSAEFLHSRRSL